MEDGALRRGVDLQRAVQRGQPGGGRQRDGAGRLPQVRLGRFVDAHAALGPQRPVDDADRVAVGSGGEGVEEGVRRAVGRLGRAAEGAG